MRTTVATSLLALMMLVGCKAVEPPTGVLGSEGFEAFPTPREFDNAGTIFRVDSSGKRLGASTLPVLPTRFGGEHIPKMSKSSEMSLKQLVETIGAKAAALPAKASANLSATSETTVESTTGVRYGYMDDHVTAALSAWASTHTPVKGQKYYLIRETIQTDRLTYKVNRKWLGDFGLDAKSLGTAGYTGEAKIGSNDTLELDAKFGKEMNVWYKTEEVDFEPALGGGPNQFRVVRNPMTKRLPGL